MPKFITKNQMIGDIGEAFVAYLLSSKLNVIYRSISRRDTGIDGEIELTESYTDTKFKATGIFIKTQIKSSVNKKFTKGRLKIKLSKEDIEYISSDINLPSILLFVNLTSKIPNVYLTTIFPYELKNKCSIEISKRNKINDKTIQLLKDIEMFYKTESFRKSIDNILNDFSETIVDRVNKSSSDNELGYILSNDFKIIEALSDVYALSFNKFKNIPKNFSPFDAFYHFCQKIELLKNKINQTLSEKGFYPLKRYIE